MRLPQARHRAWRSRPRHALGFDPGRAFVVGDHAGDVGMGRAVGATTFLVLTGHGVEERAQAAGLADHVVADLAAAADIITSLVDKEAE